MKTYKAVAIDEDSDYSGPVGYVGVPAAQWGKSIPTVVLVEAAPYPNVTPIEGLLESIGWIEECPICGDPWNGEFHRSGGCELYNRFLDATDCLKQIKSYKP